MQIDPGKKACIMGMLKSGMDYITASTMFFEDIGTINVLQQEVNNNKKP